MKHKHKWNPEMFDPTLYSQCTGRELWDIMVSELRTRSKKYKAVQFEDDARARARQDLRTDILYWLKVYTIDTSEASACLTALALLGDE